MIYLLCTCILSLFFRKERHVIEELKTKSPDQIKISTITTMEIEYELQLNPALRNRIRPLWQTFKGQTEVLSFSEADAICAAHIRSVLKKEGRPIGPYDVLLAGMAKNRNLTFVTDNMSEFTRVQDLLIENWMKAH